MADTPLLKKLRIVEGSRVALLHAPRGYRRALGPLPKGVVLRSALGGRFDLVQGFYRYRRDLIGELRSLRAGLEGDGILWLSYPKGTSGEASDLKRDILMELAPSRGLKAVAAISIDEIWTAIRFKRVAKS